MTQTLAGRSLLSHWGVIRAQGADAASFIHNQLTQDFLQLPPTQARLAAFCNAKGRMQASFIGIKPAAEEVLLLCNRDLLATTLKRLKMFVLRARCQLSDASADYQLWGLLGESVPTNPAAAPWTAQPHAGATLIHLYPSAQQARALWLAPAGTPAPDAPDLPLPHWRWTEVMSGVPLLEQTGYEQWVPQMLNYESIGGVNFKKGCYPGQEVVARSQFRGTLKRRMYLAQAPQAIAAGMEVLGTTDSDADSPQPVGQVVQAAPHPTDLGGSHNALLVLHTSANTQTLQTNGVPLQLLPLPYPLLEDI